MLLCVLVERSVKKNRRKHTMLHNKSCCKVKRFPRGHNFFLSPLQQKSVARGASKRIYIQFSFLLDFLHTFPPPLLVCIRQPPPVSRKTPPQPPNVPLTPPSMTNMTNTHHDEKYDQCPWSKVTCWVFLSYLLGVFSDIFTHGLFWVSRRGGGQVFLKTGDPTSLQCLQLIDLAALS